MKNINDLGLFDNHFLMEKLTKLGDPPRKLDKFINWKIFESPINDAFKNEDRDLSKGGRPLNETLDAAGVFANEGKMVDASFVEAPRQRNTREGNKHIKDCAIDIDIIYSDKLETKYLSKISGEGMNVKIIETREVR